MSIGRKLGVMFLEDHGPFGPAAKPFAGVNARTIIPAITDGLSNTATGPCD